MIYLDYAANAPVDPLVLARFCKTESTFLGNPNAAHSAGQAAREELARVTDSIAALLGAEAGGVVYTSGATESNNLAIKGMTGADRSAGRHILSTPLEHPSVSESLAFLQQRGYEVERLDVGADGRVDPAQLRQRIRSDTVLAVICAVDSELGTVQPLEEIGEILRDFPHCRLHVDATQAVGKLPISFGAADTMSLSLHKFGGLNGSGLLLKRRWLPLEPQFHGGSGVTPYHSGTPTLALASAAECALGLAIAHQEARREAVGAQNRRLRQALSAYPGVRVNSPENAVPHILNVSVAGVKGTAFQRALAQRGVCVSVKSACSTDGAPSRAVLAVSGDRKNALSSWRVSLSHLTRTEELDEFLEVFDYCYHQLAP